MSKSAQSSLHCNNKRKKKSAPISKCLIFTLIKSAWGNNLQYSNGLHNKATYFCLILNLDLINIVTTHCSKLEIVLNENDTPQNQQFLLEYTLVLPKESRLQKSVDIQG